MSVDVSVLFNPSGPILLEYLLSTVPHHFILGPLGSGKTITSIWKCIRIACHQAPGADGVRRTRGLVCRTTTVDLKNTVLRDFLDILDGKLRGALGRMTWGPPLVYELRFKLPDGTRVESDIIFMGMDDPDGIDKARGMQLTYVYANEIREMSLPLIHMLYGRTGRYPTMQDGGATWRGIFGDTNMPDVDHWIHTLAEKEQPQGWQFLKQPGGVVRDGGGWALNPEAENITNLPADYYTSLVPGNRFEWIAVYLGAEYGFVGDGQPVYPEFRDSTHVRAFELDPRSPIYVGMDFGLTPAAVFAQRLKSGQWRLHSEFVTMDMGALRFGELLNPMMRERYRGFRFAAITGDPAGSTRSQSDESTPFKILKACGIDARPAPTNDWTVRRDTFARLLTRLIDGEPALLVHPQCAVLRKGLAGAYCLRRMRVAGEQYESVPRKNEYSHVCEAGQYLVLGAGEHRELLRAERDRAPRKQFADTDYNMLT